MPGYRGHLVGGACVFGFLFYFGVKEPVSDFTVIEWLTLTLLGSLFPDIDTTSKGQKLFYTILAISLSVLALRGQWFLCGVIGILSMLPIIFRHRGFFHKWWAILSLPVIFVYVLGKYFPFLKQALWYDVYFFSAGVLSHLILDFKFKFLQR